jgi:hypothetical protein
MKPTNSIDEAISDYASACILTHAQFARRFDCAVEDAEDVRENMGQNVMARCLAAGMTESETQAAYLDAECAARRASGVW